MATRIERLKEQRAAAWTQAQEYNERSTTGDDMTAEEAASWTKALDDVDTLGAEIERLERTASLDDAFAGIDDATADGLGTSPDVAHRAAFETFLRRGLGSMSGPDRDLIESRAQAIGTDAAGGYTVPEAFWAKVTESMKFFGGIGAYGEQINTSTGNPIPWPTNDDTANKGAILAENTTVAEQDLVFGGKNLGAFMYTSKMIRVSRQLLQDSGIDIEGFIARKLGERLGRATAEHFTIGTGTSQPLGLVSGVANGVTAAGAAAVTYDELVDLIHSVDAAYRATGRCRFGMHDLTLAAVRKLKDTTGQPLWQPSVQAGAPDTLLGYPVTADNNMAPIATGVKSIVFGDIASALVVRNVAGGATQRLDERYADNLQVGFLGFGRWSATVQDASAAKTLTQA